MSALIIEKQTVFSNLQAIQARCGGAELWADLSLDGQGVGLGAAARMLHDGGINCFAVSDAADAEELMALGFEHSSLLILRSLTSSAEINRLLDMRAIFTVGSPEAAAALNSAAEARRTVAEVQIKIDSGLGRYGFLPSDTEKILSIYKFMPGLAVTGFSMQLPEEKCPAANDEARLRDFTELLERLRALGVDTGTAMLIDGAFRVGRAPGTGALCIGSAILGRGRGAAAKLSRVGFIEAPLEEPLWQGAGRLLGPGAGKRNKKPLRTAVVPVGWANGVGLSPDAPHMTARGVFSGVAALLRKMLRRRKFSVRIEGARARAIGPAEPGFTVLDVTALAASSGAVVTIDADPRAVRGLDIVYR